MSEKFGHVFLEICSKVDDKYDWENKSSVKITNDHLDKIIYFLDMQCQNLIITSLEKELTLLKNSTENTLDFKLEGKSFSLPPSSVAGLKHLFTPLKTLIYGWSKYV